MARAGAGGSGEVFRAIDETTGAEVALKIARDATGRRALSREARYATLALSPRLPELIDVGWISIDGAAAETRETPGDAFLALRWVEGAPLSAPRSRTAGARVELALMVARDVGEALGDLHGVGIAHGDLKPENVIVDSLGRAHLLDLGLACALYTAGVEGATPRYLARGDSDLGDARARDMAALGTVLAEIADETVAASENPVNAARSARLPDPIYAICAALLAPNPGARPSAAWVTETARAALEATSHATDDRAERDARRVRAAYLGIRRAEMEGASRAAPDAAPWLAEALEQGRRAAAIGDPAGPSLELPRDPLPDVEVLEPLRAEQIARWLLALVGPPAASWPIGAIAAAPERSLAEGLTKLARRIPPRAWTFGDVEAAALEQSTGIAERSIGSPPLLPSSPIDAAASARLAIAIAKVPPDPLAIEAVEQRGDAPAELLLTAADALRLQGDHGRARSLILRASAQGIAGAEGLSVEVLRRAGDIPLAEERAHEAIARGADADGRARAALARIALGRGRLDEAETLAKQGTTAPLCEARALVATAKGEERRARSEIARGEALARTAEERARFLALRGYSSHATDSLGSLAAYTAAVDYAVRAGAVEEEATYRTGEAAAAVDVGDLERAIGTATRAALLYEHLGRPAHAARALLACAAAYATAGARHDAARVAREAIARAREGADPRAEAYALWAIADTSPAASEEGLRAAQRAASLLAGGSPEDELRAAARLLRHDPMSISSERMADLDRRAGSDLGLSPPARLEWWGARAERLLAGDARPANGEPAPRIDGVLAAIVTLADARAPVASRGPALAAGHALAILAGQGDTAQRLLASLADAARDLVRRSPPDLLDSVRSLPWVARAAAAPESGMRPEQARDLEALIHSLSERERLGPLLNRVVDAIVLWTGVERGLLLLKAPDDRLAPRAARNLARADLRGEQMTLSQTLARRALEAREPVVAVDAAGELPNVHASVHALKLRSVLAVPLIARGEALGVVYLDDRVRRGAFGPRELSWVRTIASLAAVAIADARDQVLLRRAARRAKRASAELTDLLAKREAALDAAERELARARGSRGTRYRYDEIVGESEVTRSLLKLVDRVTAADIPVLIEGESGSGKELVARAIHANGPRAARRFVSENCGAIPEGLLESALFGHVRGAFTGADRPRAGLFEIADQGTLFLDEIGEMSLGMQTKLLRVLEDGMLRPVGSERARKVNVRIITATHRDLAAMVKAKTFREDLYYRLNIITIRIPPLRERSSDIPLIVHHLLRKHGGASGVKPRVTQAAMDRLVAFAWPGNVRQLENEIRRALVLSDGTIDVEHLSPEIAGQTAAAPREEVGLNVRRRIDALEVALVRDALQKTRGNQTQAAKLLGLSRFGLQKMIRRLKIE